MENQAMPLFNFKKLATSKKPEEDPVYTKSVDNKKDIDNSLDQPIVYDYMNYPSNKKKNAKLSKCTKVQKTVSFNAMVELVTFTDNWKMKITKGKLRTEEEQVWVYLFYLFLCILDIFSRKRII